jgi:hypothetical protein
MEFFKYKFNLTIISDASQFLLLRISLQSPVKFGFLSNRELEELLKITNQHVIISGVHLNFPSKFALKNRL